MGLEEAGKKIRQMRREMGYSQTGFAREIGIDRMTMARVEKGYCSSVDYYLKIAECLNLSLDYLLLDKDTNQTLQEEISELVARLVKVRDRLGDNNNGG